MYAFRPLCAGAVTACSSRVSAGMIDAATSTSVGVLSAFPYFPEVYRQPRSGEPDLGAAALGKIFLPQE